MKITYWSDYACPYCYIGERRMEMAIETLGIDDKVQVEMKSFEMNPKAPKTVQSETIPRFAEKYRLSEEEAAKKVEEISQMGRDLGIDFRYKETRYTNTMDAHRLTKLIQSKGNCDQTNEAIRSLFDLYFTQNKELSDREELVKIGKASGVSSKEVEDLLNSDMFLDEVRRDERDSGRQGVHRMPFFIINDKYRISGPHKLERFIKIIGRAAEEEGLC